MIHLKVTDFLVIQQFFLDFQKHSKCFEMPPDEAEFLGIYENEKLIGYFVTRGYANHILEIQQGYLLPEYRHLNLSKDCVSELERVAKKVGYTRIDLCTQNRFKAYMEFMKGLNFKPKTLIFSKEI